MLVVVSARSVMGVSGGWAFGISDKAPGGRGVIYSCCLHEIPHKRLDGRCLYSIPIVAFDISRRGIAAVVHSFMGKMIFGDEGRNVLTISTHTSTLSLPIQVLVMSYS